jgi:cytochrome c oxidase accessory protein FixG
MEGKMKLDVRRERLEKSNGKSIAIHENQFRDSIATVDAQGKRLWIYPKKPSGSLHRWRIVVTLVLLSMLFLTPFIKIGGHPLFLFNVFERKFVLFGQAFWPQDFVLLAIVLITFFVFIILFTVVFGRVWCGWLCPQTLFMEMVFRKIEYFIEGDAAAQKRLEKESWGFVKFHKKFFKHAIFIFISFLIAHTMLTYIIGVESTMAIIKEPPAENVIGFISMVSFTGIFYFIYAKFREQACIAVCPYGRLQGVLLGKESIVVAYDWLRGEPRGHLRKNSVAMTSTQGDCIDCHLCVQVCPTGIDIRNGTQMECVNCTACIDACDDVMTKIGKPKGLIRFASINSITNRIQKIINPRVIGYSFVLMALMGILGFALITRSDVETTILKVPGTLYQREPGLITNLYNVEFVNKTFNELNLEIKVELPVHAKVFKVDGKAIVVPAEGLIKSVYFIKIPDTQVMNARTVVTLGVYSQGKKLETVKAKFIGPVTKAADGKRN